MVPLDGLQVDDSADRQPLFVTLAAAHHRENMLRQHLSGLHDHGLIAGLQLLINVQCAFDGGGCNRLFNRVGDRLAARAPRMRATPSQCSVSTVA